MEKENQVETVATKETKKEQMKQTVNRFKRKELPEVTNRYPKHFVEVALLVKNNAEIKRFTALGIINYLMNKGIISGYKNYVIFKWTKFAVKSNGLMCEYNYTEPFFLNALIASFSSFSASAQKIINSFVRTEASIDIQKACDQEEISNIVKLNEEYVESKATQVVED